MNAKKISISTWDKIAPNFGKVGPKYWDDFGKRLVELSNIDSGTAVLDIGSGRGASLFPALDKVGKDGSIVGIDSSEVMVNETSKEILLKNICNAKLKNMNAQYLDFEENSFDNIICGFGFWYLLEGEDTFNGILRVLKKGGQAGFSIWGVQEDQKWFSEIVNEYLPPVKQDKNTKKTDIPKFDTVEDIMKILNDFGFINIKVHQENSYVIYKNTEEWWQEMWTNAVRGILEQIEALGSTVFSEFKKDIFKRIEKFNNGNGLYFNTPVIYAFGEKQFY